MRTLAHQTWFVPDDVGADWSFVVQLPTLLLLGGAVLLTLAARVLARRGWSGVDVPLVARLAPWLPFVMRMHLGVSLVGLLSLGFYLSPTMPLTWSVPSVLLGAIMLVVAVLVFAGWRTRAAAWLLVAAGPLGLIEYGVLDVLQRADLLGVAAFLLVTGGGRWSADHELARDREVGAVQLARAVWLLRVAVGGTLIVVAFTEKLAQPDLALRFLAEYPYFNVFAQLGLGTSDLEFARIAGAVEVLFGLLIISGALPQPGVVAIGIPFNLTLFFFGTVELVGHLPIYGTMVVLLVLGSDPDHRPRLMEPWPWGARRDAAASAGGSGDVRRRSVAPGTS